MQATIRQADICDLREFAGGQTLTRAEYHSSMQELMVMEKSAQERLDASHGELRGHHDLEQSARASQHASASERVSNLEQLREEDDTAEFKRRVRETPSRSRRRSNSSKRRRTFARRACRSLGAGCRPKRTSSR